MKSYLFQRLLQKEGILNDVFVSVNDEGIITAIEKDSSIEPDFKISGLTIPGFQNAHSHAFQYAMAGLAEVHPAQGERDDFWSWRESMYKLALSVSPDEMEAIASMLYAEMVRHGYTNVAEFHYVHHDKNGSKYDNLAEMGSRLISAAENAGINITLVPIFYQKGGFGLDPVQGQKRFISPTIEEYLKLLESSQKACANSPNANIGIGIHSLRGVEPKDIAEIAKSGPQDIPFHIHIAEQLKEIEDSIAYLGKRPVEWLADNVDLNDRYHLVHATHLTAEETKSIAQCNANVVICPTTEGNLGDGIFPLIDYQKANGNWSIGTDSHIGINPLEELRLLDYGQRLISHRRDTFAQRNGNSGQFAIEMATVSGRKAMNDFQDNYFTIGSKLNACVVDLNAPLLATTRNENLLSALVYTSDIRHFKNTIVNGVVVSENGNHLKYDLIRKKFEESLSALGNR